MNIILWGAFVLVLLFLALAVYVIVQLVRELHDVEVDLMETELARDAGLDRIKELTFDRDGWLLEAKLYERRLHIQEGVNALLVQVVEELELDKS